MPVLGSTTVAMRSKRQRRALPPRRRSTLVDGFDQMGLVFGLGEDAPELARARERSHQQMGVPAPGGLGQFDPVPLDLFARRVLDLDGGPALDPVARLAVRAQRMGRRPRVKLW